MAKVVTELGSFAFIPHEARAPFSEALSWLTDVSVLDDGTESRICLRQQPRQVFKPTYSTKLSQDAFNTAYGVQVGAWVIPAWGEAQLAGTLAAGATAAPVGNAAADLRAGSLALLWGLGGVWEVVQLDTVAAGSVTFPAITSAIKRAYLVPLRQGRTIESRKNTNGYEYVWQLTQEAEDNIDLSPVAPTQYLGDDIYYDVGLINDNGIDELVFTRVNRTDFDIGGFALSTPWTNARASRPYIVMTETPAEAWAFRLWLHRRQGRYRAFWQPTFENDFRLAQSGLIGAALTVKADSWADYASNRTHIAVESDDGWEPRAITDSLVTGDEVTLTLDTALNVNADSIRRISYLGLRRLDTDEVDLNWIGGGVCQSTVRIVELSP